MLIYLIHCFNSQFVSTIKFVFFIGIKTVYMKTMNIAGKGYDLHEEIFPSITSIATSTFKSTFYQSKTSFTVLLIVLNIATTGTY